MTPEQEARRIAVWALIKFNLDIEDAADLEQQISTTFALITKYGMAQPVRPTRNRPLKIVEFSEAS